MFYINLSIISDNRNLNTIRIVQMKFLQLQKKPQH